MLNFENNYSPFFISMSSLVTTAAPIDYVENNNNDDEKKNCSQKKPHL